ncbi:MAG: hypothetical protein OEY22_05280 [Candidatus Bathyarchaeota archaeon]|nr:hypothetical protein [Candidatus Bathyarchaeota archaeon]MDH5788077.1 hypothetical protein [Candidatus Bathyarchaeota archaeon]
MWSARVLDTSLIEDIAPDFVAVFEGDARYDCSNETRFVAVVQNLRVSVFLNVEPREFKPGDYVTLLAHVTNMSSSSPWASATVRFYKSFANNSTSLIGDPLTTNGSGWAVLPNHCYSFTPSEGPYAFLVTVDDGEILAINYFDLTVSNKTELLFSVEKEDTNTLHVLSGWLLSNSQGVANKPIEISVNGTVRETALTNGTGFFSLKLDLQPENASAATYSLEAVFEGEEPQSVTSYHHTSNSTLAVCTTFYYEYKPSSNTTSLTVSPQSTDTLAPTKTPEEMQAEAEQGEWLSIWHEFGWWYPWYRLHVKISINPVIDIGFNPILPGGETYFWQGLDTFAGVLEEIWEDIILDFMGVFISYAIAKGLSIWNLAAGLIAEGVKALVQYGFLWIGWNDPAKMLATSIANFLMGFIALATHVGEAFVKALFSIICGPAWAAIMLTTNGMIPLAAPLQIIRTPVDYVESVFVDFPIAILALLRYLGRI